MTQARAHNLIPTTIDPLERSTMPCGVCSYVATASTPAAARAALYEHMEWHRHPQPAAE